MSPADRLLKYSEVLPPEEEGQVYADLVLAGKVKCEESFAHFVRCAWHVIEPGRKLKWNWSIDLICSFLEAFARREFHRGIINVPPRFMKSLLVSVFYPVWVWIQNKERNQYAGPSHQFLCLSNAENLVLRDADVARNLIESEWFQERWGTGIGQLELGDPLEIADAQNEKKYYKNKQNGHRSSKTISARVTGQGGDTILGDDLHDADDVMSDPKRVGVLESWDGKVRSRLNDQVHGGIMIIMQRLHGLDIVGHVLKKDGYYHPKKNPKGWMKLSLPMQWEADEQDQAPVNPAKLYGFKDPRVKPGELLWPSRFPKDVVEDLAKGLDWRAPGQLQQRPAAKGGGVLKERYWKTWGVTPAWTKGKTLPFIKHAFASWDTAYSEEDKKNNAFSACTVWGIFWDEDAERDALLLLHTWHGMVDFSDLKDKAIEFATPKGKTPPLLMAEQGDAHLVENKASGISLIQELRRLKNVQVRGYNPAPDGSKLERAYIMGQPPLKAGQVFVQDTPKHKQFVEILGTYPHGAPPCKDYTDTYTQAIAYLRRGEWIQHPDDEQDEEEEAPDKYNYDGWDDEPDDDDEKAYQGAIYG